MQYDDPGTNRVPPSTQAVRTGITRTSNFRRLLLILIMCGGLAAYMGLSMSENGSGSISQQNAASQLNVPNQNEAASEAPPTGAQIERSETKRHPPADAERTGAIRVSVLDGSRPISNLLVSCESIDTDRLLSPPMTRATHDGEAYINQLAPGRYRVTCQGCRPSECEVIPNSDTQVLLNHSSDSRVRGRVVDRQGGPMPFALVHIYAASKELPYLDFQGTIETDARGTFVLPVVGPRYTLFASAKDNCSSVQTLRSASGSLTGNVTDVDLTIDRPAYGARGTVTKTDSSPVAGVDIAIVTEAVALEPSAVTSVRLRHSVTADATGSWSLHSLPSEKCSVTARSQDLAWQSMDWTRASNFKYDIVLDVGIAICGTAVDDRGIPIAGATVAAYELSGFAATQVHKTDTDSGGRFNSHVRALSSGFVVISKSGFLSKRTALPDIMNRGHEVQLGSIVVQRLGLITGQIVTSTGIPCRNLRLQLHGPRGPFLDGRTLEARVGVAGRFAVEVERGTPYSIQVYDRLSGLRVPASQNPAPVLSPGRCNVTVDSPLLVERSVNGRFTFASGRPVSKQSFALIATGGGSVSGRTDEFGCYSLDVPVCGVYSLCLIGRGSAIANAATIVIAAESSGYMGTTIVPDFCSVAFTLELGGMRASEPASLEKVRVCIFDAERDNAEAVAVVRNSGAAILLKRGKYRLHFEGDSVRDATEELDVSRAQPGEMVKRVIRLQSGVSVRLALCVSECGLGSRDQVQLVCYGGPSSRVERKIGLTGEETIFIDVVIEPGAYTVEIREGDQLLGVGQLTVPREAGTESVRVLLKAK